MLVDVYRLIVLDNRVFRKIFGTCERRRNRGMEKTA
jgi:hypothetical protein